jgi:hypothetical protein
MTRKGVWTWFVIGIAIIGLGATMSVLHIKGAGILSIPAGILIAIPFTRGGRAARAKRI